MRLYILALSMAISGCATVIDLLGEPKRYQDCNVVNDAEYFECVQYNYQLRKEGVE